MLSRTTRILLAVTAIALIAYLLFDRASRRSEEKADIGLATFDVSRVDDVTLERADVTIRFAREDSAWRMTEPLQDVAEPAMVISLLDALEHADVARNLGATEDLAPFGLDPPEVRITLRAGGDTLLAAALGNRTVDDAWCYALAGSRELLLIPTNVARAATAPVNAYRNQRVVDFQLRDVGSFAFHTAGRSSKWLRATDGWYAIESGDTVAGDSVAVEAVLRRLRGMRVASFLEATYAEDTDRFFGIDVWEIGGAPLAQAGFYCSLDRTCQGFASWGMQRSFVLEGDIEDLFELSTTSLRERRLIQFSPPDAARIEVVSPDGSGAIVRTGGAWAFPNPALGRVDPERAADFVRALRSLKWTDIPAMNAPKELRAARFSITVTNESDTILDELRADPHVDGLWYVTSRSSRGVWMIDGNELNALADRFAQLKSR